MRLRKTPLIKAVRSRAFDAGGAKFLETPGLDFGSLDENFMDALDHAAGRKGWFCAIYRKWGQTHHYNAEANHAYLCRCLKYNDNEGYSLLLGLPGELLDVNFHTPGTARIPVVFEAVQHSPAGFRAILAHPRFDPNVVCAVGTLLDRMISFVHDYPWATPELRLLLDHPRADARSTLARLHELEPHNGTYPDARALLSTCCNRSLLFVLAQPLQVRRLRLKHKNWLTTDLVRLLGSFLTYKKILVL